MRKSPLLLIASLLTAGTILAATASPAIAAPPAAQTRIVSYADLDLTRAAGRATLERRIDRAVRAVCGRAAPTDLNGLDQVQLCRAETLADAAAQWRAGEVLVAEARAGVIVFAAQ